MTTLTNEEFDQAPDRAKRAATDGPVFITHGGQPAHVMLSIKDYQRLTGGRRNIAEALSMPGVAENEVEFPRSRALPRLHDLS